MENREIIVEKKKFYFDKGYMASSCEYSLVKCATLVDGIVKFETNLYKGRYVEKSNEIENVCTINDYELNIFLKEEFNNMVSRKYSDNAMYVIEQLLVISQIYNYINSLRYIIYSREKQGTMRISSSSGYKYYAEYEFLNVICFSEGLNAKVDAKRYLCDKLSESIKLLPNKWFEIEENEVLLNIDEKLRLYFKEMDVLKNSISKNIVYLDNIIKDESLKRYNMYAFKTDMSDKMFNDLENELDLPIFSNLNDSHSYVVLFFEIEDGSNVFVRQRLYKLLRNKLDMKLKVIRRNVDNFEILVGKLS